MKRLAALAAGLLPWVVPPPAIAQNEPAPISRFAERKAETLLREQLPCLGCHQLGDEGGRVGPDLSSVRRRRSPGYIAAMITDPQRVVPGSAMPKTPMPESTRSLIIRYLASRPGDAPPGAPPGAPPISGQGAQPATGTPASSGVSIQPPNGALLYARWCSSCHGSQGKGNGPNAQYLPVKPADHTDAALESARPDDSLYDTIAGGGAIMNRSPRMPAFGASLTAAEIRSLVAHIRTLCRCEGPQWSRDDARVGRR